jgi:uncharacterized protein involved in type VI secretion and phage assembly
MKSHGFLRKNNSLIGKFPAVVTDIHDPKQLGRIRVRIPALGSTLEDWALPCVPFSLPKRRGAALPAIGSNVWIEFLLGDISRPIWVGCFYDAGSKVPPALRPPAK